MPRGRWWIYTILVIADTISSTGAATVAFSNGVKKNERFSNRRVSGMSFSVTKEGTMALCELNFSTDLTVVSSASVSCQILHDLQGTQTAIGETTHAWTFYADIEGDVFKVGATLSFDPTTNSLSHLILCFQSVCGNPFQNCLDYPPKEGSSSISTGSSTPEGFVLNFGSNHESSASATSSTPEGFVFNFGSAAPSKEESKVSACSSQPEGFVLNFGSAQSSSSGGGKDATTAMPTGTFAIGTMTGFATFAAGTTTETETVATTTKDKTTTTTTTMAKTTTTFGAGTTTTVGAATGSFSATFG